MRAATPVTIAGIRFANPLMNGAYIHSKSSAEITRLTNSHAGGVVAGSISLKKRTENIGQNYWQHKENFYALNSYGMPNGGLSYFRKHLPLLVEAAHAAGKPLVANVIGFSNTEFAELVAFADQAGADIIELNLGCPNVWDERQQKQILSYHPKLVKELLEHLKNINHQAVLAVKISPLPPDILAEVSTVISSSQVRIVTATNSYPNATPTTGTGGNTRGVILAGLSGRALKPISLGVVTQLRTLLPKHIDIIGCGGISSARDVHDYLEAGASAVQIATALVDEGPALFEKILFQSRTP